MSFKKILSHIFRHTFKKRSIRLIYGLDRHVCLMSDLENHKSERRAYGKW